MRPPFHASHLIDRLTNPPPDLLNPNLDKLEDETSGTSIEALTSRPRTQQSREASILASAVSAASTENASTTAAEPSSAQDLEEEEASQEGAFNPETGEINWDCQCLGGMAHGPCGPQFREAFSCFVYSDQEPKGMDCIEKFQGMQECFKEHPEVYKGELDEDEGDEGEYDEAMLAEKEELVREIKERRERAGIQADGKPQERLLEESATPVKPKARSQSKKVVSSKTLVGEAPEKPTSEAKASPPAGNEDINEGHKSSTIRRPNPPSVGPSSDEGQELIPRAAHDASHAAIPDDNKPKP